MKPFRTLADRLRATASRFEKSQMRHFRTMLGDEERIGTQVEATIVSMTRAVLATGNTMIHAPQDDLPGKLARALIEDDVNHEGRLLGQIELEIARSFALDTDKMAHRCLSIAQLALEVTPGDVVQKFLGRVGRCYIAGFFPESVVMCRAALENAVLERFDRENKHPPIPPPGKSAMNARLMKAEDLGWLTRKQREEARSIWERGSTTAHRDPYVTKAALDTIRMTMELVRTLVQESPDLA